MKTKYKHGFTIIEFLVVVAILAALLIPALVAAKAKHDALIGTAEQAPARFQLTSPMDRLVGTKQSGLYVGVVKDSKTGVEYILTEDVYHSATLTPLITPR